MNGNLPARAWIIFLTDLLVAKYMDSSAWAVFWYVLAGGWALIAIGESLQWLRR